MWPATLVAGAVVVLAGIAAGRWSYRVSFWTVSVPMLLVVATLGAVESQPVPSLDAELSAEVLTVAPVLVWVGACVGRRRWSWSMLVPPALAVIGALTVASGAPVDVRFAASRAAFTDVARQLSAGGDPAEVFSTPRRLGQYTVVGVEVNGSDVFFQTSAGEDSGGFLYRPSAALDDGLRHLGGPWYAGAAPISPL